MKKGIQVMIFGMVGLLGLVHTGYTAPPTIMNVFPASNIVGVYERYQMQFDLTTSFNNSFDPNIVDIQAVFTSPTNVISTTFAFWYQKFNISGGVNTTEIYTAADMAHWLIRFAPLETGNYTYVIYANTIYGNSTSTTIHFTATNSNNNGFVRLHQNNPKYFQLDNGSVYYPIGHDLAGGSAATHPSLDGVTSARYYHSRMAANDVNWIRFWMTNVFNNALEWTGTGYSGVGKYALDKAYRIDKIFDSAQNNNLYVQFTISDFRLVSNWAAGFWPQSPYNIINGGPIPNASPQDFFSNTSAKDLYKQQLRYVVARWGYLPNIFAWELFNEVEYTGDNDQNPFSNITVKNDIVTWHQEMGSYLKSIDPNRHLVTTSSDDPWYGRYGYYNYSLLSSLWLLPEMDIIQTHIYTFTIEDDIIQQSRFFHDTFNKAHMVGEFGIQNLPEANNSTTGSSAGSSFNPNTFVGSSTQRDHLIEGTHFHNALWTALMSESMAGMWWWDTYLESDSTQNRNSPQFPLYYHYKAMNTFMHFTMNPSKYQFEDWPNYVLTTAVLSMSTTIRAVGLSSPDRAYIWYRDIENDYFQNYEPGDMVNRTISNATITIYNFTPNSQYAYQYFDTYNNGGPVSSIQYLQSSPSGTLTLNLPPFQRDLSVKVYKNSVLTSIPPKLWNTFP